MAHIKIRSITEEDGKPVLVKSGFGTIVYLVDGANEYPIPGTRVVDIHIGVDEIVTANIEFAMLELPEDILAKIGKVTLITPWNCLEYKKPPFGFRSYQVRYYDRWLKRYVIQRARWCFWRWSRSTPKHISEWRE